MYTHTYREKENEKVIVGKGKGKRLSAGYTLSDGTFCKAQEPPHKRRKPFQLSNRRSSFNSEIRCHMIEGNEENQAPLGKLGATRFFKKKCQPYL